MKKKLIHLSTVLLIIPVILTGTSCTRGAGENVYTDDLSGNSFNLSAPMNTNIAFINHPGSFTDSNNVLYPVNADGCLTSLQSSGKYFTPAQPAILAAYMNPNYGKVEAQSFGYEYSVTFRYTDPTTVSTSTTDKSVPQGLVLFNIYLNGTNPNGALAVMIFPANAFPTGSGLTKPNLDENVFLVANYDGAGSGNVIAVANVDTLTVPSTVVSPLTGDDTADGFHTALWRIYSDAAAGTQTISVFIDNVEVICYTNTTDAGGTTYSHTLSSTAVDAWDSQTSLLGTAYSITETVLKLSWDRAFQAGSGADIWKEIWNTMTWKTGVNKDAAAGLVTFGALFQIGCDSTGKINSALSAQIKNISVIAYTPE